MDIKKQYNKIGKKYVSEQAKFFGEDEDLATNFILKNLPDVKNKVVLDFGCGHGRNIKALEKLKAKRVYGIDPSRVMIAEAKKFLGQDENLFVEDIQKTRFPDKYFDIVVSRHALHYLNSFEKAYRELARIMKKGGALIFIVNHPLRDFGMKKTKNYWKKEIAAIKLYNNSVTLHFPTHTLGEYFSKEFFTYFQLQNLEEGSGEAGGAKTPLPAYLGIKAIRK